MARDCDVNGIAARIRKPEPQEIVMAGSDAETVEDAVVTMLINRAIEVVNMPKITPSFYREVVGLVVRLREQKISMERLKLERACFELDVADLVMKHLTS